MPQKINLETWWDKKYFYTEGPYRPLYITYRKLHKAGADLDSIEAFCNYLRCGELFVDLFLSERTKGKRKSLLAARVEEVRPSEIEIFAALNEFLLLHLLHLCWSRGKKVDIWGSIFVLIVTEHMRAVCGKPRGHLADELLRAVRRQLGLPSNANINRDGRRRAEDRIKKLKMAHADRQKHSPAGQSVLFHFISLELNRRRAVPTSSDPANCPVNAKSVK